MKICMLTTIHPPLDGRIFQKEAKSLAKLYDVVIITSDENEADWIEDGIRIVTVKRSKSKVFHLLTMWRVFKKGWKQECDVYHCHEPDSLFIGVILKILKRKKLIYDIHEHWPSEISYGWFKIKNKYLSGVIQTIVSGIEITLSHFSDLLITVNNSVASRFSTIKKVHIIPNVPILKIFDSSFGTNERLKKSLIFDINSKNTANNNSDLVLVGGKIQSFYGLYDSLHATSMVKEKHPNIQLKFIGEIKDDISSIIKEYDISDNLIVTGFLPYREMYKEISSGGIGLVLFKSEYFNIYVGLPNKLFDYMLCGLPVIASDFPEIRRIVKNENCGILVNPANINEIRDAIVYLIENPIKAKQMGENGQKAVMEKYNWNVAEKQLFEIYEGIEKYGIKK